MHYPGISNRLREGSNDPCDYLRLWGCRSSGREIGCTIYGNLGRLRYAKDSDTHFLKDRGVKGDLVARAKGGAVIRRSCRVKAI